MKAEEKHKRCTHEVPNDMFDASWRAYAHHRTLAAAASQTTSTANINWKCIVPLKSNEMWQTLKHSSYIPSLRLHSLSSFCSRANNSRASTGQIRKEKKRKWTGKLFDWEKISIELNVHWIACAWDVRYSRFCSINGRKKNTENEMSSMAENNICNCRILSDDDVIANTRIVGYVSSPICMHTTHPTRTISVRCDRTMEKGRPTNVWSCSWK